MNAKKPIKTQWKPTDNRFVCFLDILGFKDMVMRSSHEEIYELLNRISADRNKLSTVIDKGLTENPKFDADIYTVSFSDSIVIFSKNDDLVNFKLFIASVNWLFARAIINDIPLKGAVAHGQISLNKTNQIYFGQPIIDAYLLEEEVNYFGVVAHNSIDKYMIVNNFDDKDNYFFESETPLKSGLITHTNLNWFSKLLKKDGDDSTSNDSVIERIVKFKKSTSGSPRKYIDNTVKIYSKIK